MSSSRLHITLTGSPTSFETPTACGDEIALAAPAVAAADEHRVERTNTWFCGKPQHHRHGHDLLRHRLRLRLTGETSSGRLVTCAVQFIGSMHVVSEIRFASKTRFDRLGASWR